VHLFNLLSLRSHDGVTVGDTIAVVEGEIDAVSLTQLGIPAVAIPGAHNWRPYHRRVFDGFERIVFFYDRDVTREVNGKEINAGRELLKTLMASGLPIEPAEPPGGKDVNDAIVAGFGDRLVEIFRGKRES
jgi:DNA primase